MTDFLNGVEIIEKDTGGRVITTPSTSVIGVVGTITGVGVDEKFPLNTPVLVTKVQDVLDMNGTVADSIRGVYKQTNAVCVVVRVAEGNDINATIANAQGDEAAYTGVYALLQAESMLQFKPKILLCPYYSSILKDDKTQNGIVSALVAVADKLRAVAIVDGTNTTAKDAMDFAGKVGSSRLYLIDPAYKSFDSNNRFLPSSSLVAGALAKNDAEKGFWWSPSNTEIKGVSGLSRPISFSLSDKTTESNLMNSKGVATIVFSGGVYKLWGNRSVSKDNKWHYLSVRRTVDTIYDALEASIEWALAKPFSKQLFSEIENNLQTYLNMLVSSGALLGGKVWVDAEENNVTTYTNGQLIVKFDLEPAAPVERLTFKAYRNNAYVEELFN